MVIDGVDGDVAGEVRHDGLGIRGRAKRGERLRNTDSSARTQRVLRRGNIDK